MDLSAHARTMLSERRIPEEWVWRTIDKPDRTEPGPDGNVHYIAAIPERAGRFLRVIVNPHVQPVRIVTLFFDRRLRQQK